MSNSLEQLYERNAKQIALVDIYVKATTVKEHQMATKTGKTVTVAEHQDSRPEAGGDSSDDGSRMVYHGTKGDNVKSILKNGFTIGNKRAFSGIDKDLYKGDRGKSVFVEDKHDEAHTWAYNSVNGDKKIAVFGIKIPKTHQHLLKKDEINNSKGGASYYNGHIPKEWIHSLHTKEPGEDWVKEKHE